VSSFSICENYINKQHNIVAFRVFKTSIRNKLTPYGTDGRLFTTDVSANLQSHVTQKLSRISKIRPDQI